MESNGSRNLDKQLAELRSVLEQVHTPERIESHLADRLDELTFDRQADVSRRSKWWIPVGLAASFVLIVVGVRVTAPDVKSEIPDPIHGPMSGYLVARTQIPVRVHSLSRGAELRYLDSRVIRDERGVTRVVYINLPQRN